MSRTAALPRPADPPAADRGAAPAALVERQLAVLSRLADIGLEIAEAAGRQAAAGAEAGAGAGVADAALAYSRAARAVRLSIALQSRLVGEQAERRQAAAKVRATDAAQRRSRIHTRVESLIEAETPCEDEAERLSSAVWEQLTEIDDDDALFDLPLPEAVARICQALGLAPQPWVSAFTPAASPASDCAPPGDEPPEPLEPLEPPGPLGRAFPHPPTPVLSPAPS